MKAGGAEHRRPSLYVVPLQGQATCSTHAKAPLSFSPLGLSRSQAFGHRRICRRELQQRLSDDLAAYQRSHAPIVRYLPTQLRFVRAQRTAGGAIRGGEMPESWDAGEYRDRATAWLQKAESLTAGRERDACLALAEGYLNLAKLLEAQQGAAIGGGAAKPSS
jgi:hypothetical protein